MSDGINLAALGIFETTSNGNNIDEDAVVIAELTTAERVGRLEARGIDDATICDMFQLSAAELEQLRAEPEYKPALAVGQQQQVERPLRVDDSWDDVEDVALHKLRSTVHNEYDSDRLLKIAAVANRATRRSERAKSGQLDATDATSSVVHINLSPRFVQQLNIINPQQEHARIAKLATGNKMVDYMPQGEFEKAIDANVNNQTENVLEDAVAMLDLMVLNK